MTKSVLHPLKMWSYRKNPRSPADLRVDAKGGGGYNKEDILFIWKSMVLGICSSNVNGSFSGSSLAITA